MAMLAVSLPCRFGADALTSHDVLGIGYGFKVQGVEAGPIAAEVVNEEPLRYRSVVKLVGKAVGVASPASVPSLAITVAIEATHHLPAAAGCKCHFGPDCVRQATIKQRKFHGSLCR